MLTRRVCDPLPRAQTDHFSPQISTPSLEVPYGGCQAENELPAGFSLWTRFTGRRRGRRGLRHRPGDLQRDVVEQPLAFVNEGLPRLRGPDLEAVEHADHHRL